ncbi:unnamed protein product [Chironomus riparius]|uniref:ABC-type glutathione-S-conjugate transporter n=1 Tax=Chironomus riparius TaxID=315576 RepID=A0A9N9RHZ6_9DIPT|nr:unnamed protein product [Chironomus riparius]
MFEEFCGSPFWDAELTWSETNPDFTFCFKQTVLIWVPCLYLWLFSIVDLRRRSRSRRSDIPWSFLNLSKLVFTILLVCLSIVDLTLMLAIATGEEIFDVQYVSIGIKLVTFIFLVFIQLYHKKKGHRTSIYLFIFWMMLVIFAIPQLLREIRELNSAELGDGDFTWSDFQFINYVLYFSFITIEWFLCCFADKPPRNSTYPKYANPSPELGVGAIIKIFYAWFEPIAWKGYRRPLTEKDIYDINPENASAELVPKFDYNFEKSVTKSKKKIYKEQQKQLRNQQNKSIPNGTSTTETQEPPKPEGSVLAALVGSFIGPFSFALFMRFLIDFLQFGSPLVLGALITYVDSDGALWKGLVLTFALFLITFVMAILNGHQSIIAYRVGFCMRTSLISAIYRKALRISSEAKRTTTVGEIVNLMAVDSNRFLEMIPYLMLTISAPFTMSLAIFLLWRIIGVSVFAGLAVLIVMFPLSGIIANKLKNIQFRQMKIKDERVKLINEILNGIKVLKLYAWEPSFEKQIGETREVEIKTLRHAAMYNAITEFQWGLTPFLVSFVSFTTYVMLGNPLTPDVAFVALALFNILRMPMTFLPLGINFIMIAYVSIKRLNKFMNSLELDPNNVTRNPCEHAMKIQDGNFSWGGMEKTLKNINIAVNKGSLTAVVGPVGAGKSSLISAFLGEMEKLSGTANLDGRIAYVPQQAWIQNATLQDNILFGKPLNKKLYEKVIHACALTADLSMLPGGDQTEIGEKGINLSGGQKQRISLARAVYSGAEVFIFDDPLSAVDSHVGKHIFENVMSHEGMLRGKTRFLVTHALSYLPKVDVINVMLNGEITENGTYKELLARKGAFSEFLVQYLQEHQDEEDLAEIGSQLGDDEELKKIFQRSVSTMSMNRGDKSSPTSSLRRRRDSRRSSKQSEQEEMPKQSALNKLMTSEEAAIGSVSWGVYLRYFRSVGVTYVLIVVLFNIISQTASVLGNFWLTIWTQDERSHLEIFWRNLYVGVYGAFGLLQGISILVGTVLFALGSLKAARHLHFRLLHNILRLPVSFFDTTPLGRIINRFSRDTDVIDAFLPNMMRTWFSMAFALVGTIIVISYSTPIFISVIVPLMVVYYFIQRFYIATSRQLKRIESITRSPIYSHFGESVSGQSTIRAYDVDKRFIVDSETRVDHNQAVAYQNIIANRWLGIRLEIIGSFIVLFASLFAVLGRTTMESAIVGLSISYALQVSSLLNFFVRIATEVESNIVSVERVEEYADLPQEAAWKTIETNPKWPQSGIVEFSNYQFRYREGLDLVLKGINFKTNSEEKIGIVGRTGAGKSSLTLALFRIVEAAGGKIIIDDVDISGIGLHSLRSRLTIIPQDPVLFSGSLRMNIDPFNSYSDDAIWQALEHSHLKSFVKGLSDGLTHKITEGGENLSVGQRQLVCLARALLRKTKVLILDEATAAIDFETDELIQKTIRSQFNDCTILTIAHRLNTIMDSDRIIVLDAGMIAEFDTPKSLMDNKNSIFYGMARNAGLVGDDYGYDFKEETEF